MPVCLCRLSPCLGFASWRCYDCNAVSRHLWAFFRGALAECVRGVWLSGRLAFGDLYRYRLMFPAETFLCKKYAWLRRGLGVFWVCFFRLFFADVAEHLAGAGGCVYIHDTSSYYSFITESPTKVKPDTGTCVPLNTALLKLSTLCHLYPPTVYPLS